MDTNYYEKFLSQEHRGYATNDLAKKGAEALRVLEALFDGSAVNDSGVPYSETAACRCGYVTARMLGEVAKPLEKYIRLGIEMDDTYAIEAAGALGYLEPETAMALTMALKRRPFGEAAYSFVKSNLHLDKTLLDLLKDNEKVLWSIDRAKTYLNDKT